MNIQGIKHCSTTSCISAGVRVSQVWEVDKQGRAFAHLLDPMDLNISSSSFSYVSHYSSTNALSAATVAAVVSSSVCCQLYAGYLQLYNW